MYYATIITCSSIVAYKSLLYFIVTFIIAVIELFSDNEHFTLLLLLTILSVRWHNGKAMQ